METARPDTAVVEDLPSHPWSQAVEVRLDGVAVSDVLVMQGGALEHHRTDDRGRAMLMLDPDMLGGVIVVASHPDARTQGVDVLTVEDLVVVELTRFDPSDNPAYVFRDPGTPTRNESNQYCSHCHIRKVADWFGSAHAQSASNPVVHDVYAGTAARLTEQACRSQGGAWTTVRQPGGGAALTCLMGQGTLDELNPTCTAPCETPVETGACADCHAPGIDGALGGHDLLDAAGIAFEHGVHCDVCHKVADVDLEQPAGVGGRLRIVRPSETEPDVTDAFYPLMFGPLPDVLNTGMGSVHRPIFQSAELCAGCHELDQRVLVPDVAIDTERWPGGTFPVHSTYSEWQAGALGEVAPCQACHMPPDPSAGNGSDIDLFRFSEPGRVSGWWRAPGAVRRHTWTGPRSEDVDMVGLAVTLDLEVSSDGATTEAVTTVLQQGAGHAVPTGEPLRSLVLTVEASCGDASLEVLSGPAVPAFGGAKAVREAGEDWSLWPDAVVGDVLRVVRVDGWVDYAGVGPFGDGRFDAEAKGLPDLQVVGHAVITSVDVDGVVTTDRPVPDGDRVFLGAREEGTVAPLAGAAGFAFARVLVDRDGEQMVPHHRAVDVASDNRLMPGSQWSVTHRFASTCETPEVEARLTYRAYPWQEVARRGWDGTVRTVAEVTR